MAPVKTRYNETMAKFLVKHLGGLEKAAKALGVSTSMMGNYARGSHEPRKETAIKLKQLCEEAGYIAKLRDVKK
jgi:transcriptional regulator with XRE-family HTH domain